ncbi:MAG TPA: hypothetical protein VF988_08625 [Verrucomicrobiae bacterium]
MGLMLIPLNLGLLVLIGAGTWWLTGRDTTFDGRSKQNHYFRRLLRCILVLFLSLIIIALAEMPIGAYGLGLVFFLAVGIGFVLRSSIAELLSGGLFRFMDPMMRGSGTIDLKKSQRSHDAIGQLIRDGRKEEAIQLCERLKLSGDVPIVTLEQTLECLGVPQMTVTHAARLRREKKFAEAEQVLESLLVKDPADFAAGMMLIRLLALDLRQPTRAWQVLQGLQKQPNVPTERIESATRLLDQWSRAQPAELEPATPTKPEGVIDPPSIDALVAAGFFGSAVDTLEQQMALHPRDFELRLKLLEIQAIHCRDWQRAENVIRQMEREQFPPLQLQTARDQLAGWRKNRPGQDR